MKSSTLLLLGLMMAQPLPAAISNIGEGDSFPWSGTTGWIELRHNQPSFGHGVVANDTHLSGYGWSPTIGWINFGDGTPGNVDFYSNSTASDCGVNVDSLGNLSGYAWSSTCGWINFGWAGNTDANRARIDLKTGAMLGYAWGSTIGWITFDTGYLKVDYLAVADEDNDGIADAWERFNAESTTLLNDTDDYDGDGISDLDEYRADTNPIDQSDFLDIIQLVPGATTSDLTWTTRATRCYQVYTSGNLTAWNPNGAIEPGTDAPITRTITNPNSQRSFFQVRPIVPLSQP